MTQHLDARQRAMLLEMGIALPVLPARAARPAPTPAPPAATKAVQPPAGAPAPPQYAPPAPAASTPDIPAAPPFVQAQAAAAPAQALADVPLAAAVAPYLPADAGGVQHGGWLVLLECAQPADPLAGDAGRLLDNMLRAMGLHREAATRVAALVPQGQGQAAATRLDDTLAALRPRMVLLLGLGAARAVLGSREPLAQLRSQLHRLPGGTPAAVSHDPSYLLHAPQAKAAAWLDLCRALALAGDAPGGVDAPGSAPPA